MKKFRLFFKGSPKEVQFLRTQMKQGKILTGLHFGVYTFADQPDWKNLQLQTEILDSTLQPAKTSMVKQTVEKKLALRHFKIMYSYIAADSSTSIEIINETNDLEAAYLRHLDNRIFLFSALVLLASIVGIIVLEMNGISAHLLEIPLLLAIIAYFTSTHKFSKRLKVLNPAGEKERPEMTIAFKNLTHQPDMTELDYLGRWRYITVKDGVYYYRLSSNYARDYITDEILGNLSLKKEQLSIVDVTGLWPII